MMNFLTAKSKTKVLFTLLLGTFTISCGRDSDFNSVKSTGEDKQEEQGKGAQEGSDQNKEQNKPTKNDSKDTKIVTTAQVHAVQAIHPVCAQYITVDGLIVSNPYYPGIVSTYCSPLATTAVVPAVYPAPGVVIVEPY